MPSSGQVADAASAVLGASIVLGFNLGARATAQRRALQRRVTGSLNSAKMTTMDPEEQMIAATPTPEGATLATRAGSLRAPRSAMPAGHQLGAPVRRPGPGAPRRSWHVPTIASDYGAQARRARRGPRGAGQLR